MAKVKVDLIPWDPESAEHVDRLYDQRVQCGWGADKVRDVWTDWQRTGLRSLFWLVIAEEGDPVVEEKFAEHFAKNPKYKNYLKDTSKSIAKKERAPTNAQFRPVGHIALDTESVHANDAGADFQEDGLYWIGPLYVAWELQAVGVGRAALDAVEEMAVGAPLHAGAIGLDTMAKRHQEDPVFVTAWYDKPPHTTNQGWYERRGYTVFKEIEGLYAGTEDKNGKIWDLSAVFMKKKLVQ